MRCRLGVIGCGSIGQRMLRNAYVHQRVRPVRAWDPNTAVLRRVISDFPEVIAAANAEDVIEHADVDVVYVASPPMSHAPHAHAALDAAKPILCEKPLGVDDDMSRALVAHAASSGIRNAVNFIQASGSGRQLAAQVRNKSLGQVHCAELRIQGRHWAERRYAEAPWLAQSEQGGLLREVMSHYVFLAQRLFGSARVDYCHRQLEDAAAGHAETQIQARLSCDGVPVYLFGNTQGAGPDVAEFTVWGERASRRIVDLYELQGSGGDVWERLDGNSESPAARWFRLQLDNVADWAAGKPHSLPDFAEAFAVQRVVEQMHRASASAHSMEPAQRGPG